MLRTGLRKNEALRLLWESIQDIEGVVDCIVIGDTKKKRPHYVPITEDIKAILNKAGANNHSLYVFQSTQRPGNCFSSDVRIPLRKLSKMIDGI